jgi:hypothetical protein
MLEEFSKRYRLTAREQPSGRRGDGYPAVIGDLLEAHGGSTFESGLYRIHGFVSAEIANGFVCAYFPEYAPVVNCFSFDWLGRQYSLNAQSGTPNDPGILLFEPGTGLALEVPGTFSGFHRDELTRHGDEDLSVDFFRDWSTGALPFSACAGYKIPLFLGGADDESNLEVTDIDVYWTLMGQLRAKTKDLPAGASIDEISLE